ncbi:MAG: ABC transporter substrate-binding protein [Paracoccaceae bacterium]
MIGRRSFIGLLAGTAVAPRLAFADQAAASGPAGPPLQPRVINLPAIGRTTGKPGGTITTLIAGQKDIRFMTINGYARLIGYDMDLKLQPDILLGYEIVEDRIFTFHLREGHRWSDGAPFTSEDFRYYWEDVLLNTDLKPGGLPTELLADGKGPLFEVIDPTTVRYTWDSPIPAFLPRLAGAAPQVMVLPAHYMKQFHRRYAEAETLAALVEGEEVDNWMDLHTKMSRTYRPENPALPTLDPWRNTTLPPADQYIFVRNPHYHRVDQTGQQLPYIDRFLLNVSSGEIISAKTGAGESDLQMAGLDFVDYTYLKAAEKRHPIKVALWRRTQGSRVALVPNLNCADRVWRGVMQDVRVRRALSLATHRHEVNMVSFFGLANESADSVLPGTTLYKTEYASAWATYDPDQANALLDAAGLDKRGDDGLRLLPDGRPMQIIVESTGESTLETDILELVTDHWRSVGVALFIRVSQRDIFRSRALAGEIVMSAWQGMDNGVPTPDMSPALLAPTGEDQLAWPLWGANHVSHGEAGEAPDLPEVKLQLERYKAWTRSTSHDERLAIWQQMLETHADQVFVIGIVNATLQPILRSARLQNMPEDGLYGFDPTAYLGVYMPDTFWLDGDA